MHKVKLVDLVKKKRRSSREIVKSIGELFHQNNLKNHTRFIEDLRHQIYELDKPVNIILCLIANYGDIQQSYDLNFLKPLRNLLTELKESEAICLN